MLKLFKKQKEETIRFYFSCDDLPIYHFHKIMETGNYCYMVTSWDEQSEIKFDRDKAVERWGQIYNEYCKLTSNNRAIMYYRKAQELIFLETRNEVCGKMMVQMSMRNMKHEIFLDYINVLRSFKIPYEKDVKDLKCMENAARFLKASKNNIDLLRDELEKMVEKGEHTPFEKELVSVEQALGRNEVDPRKTSVTKWVFMIEKIKEMVEQQRKQAAKRR